MSLPVPHDAVFVHYNPATLPILMSKLVAYGAVFIVDPGTKQIAVSVSTATAILGFRKD